MTPDDTPRPAPPKTIAEVKTIVNLERAYKTVDDLEASGLRWKDANFTFDSSRAQVPFEDL